MTNAIHDENRVKVWLAVSYLDPTVTVPIQISSTNGGVKIDTTHTISFTPDQIAIRDEDWKQVVMGEDENGNPCPLFADPATGAILIDM